MTNNVKRYPGKLKRLRSQTKNKNIFSGKTEHGILTSCVITS